MAVIVGRQIALNLCFQAKALSEVDVRARGLLKIRGQARQSTFRRPVLPRPIPLPVSLAYLGI